MKSAYEFIADWSSEDQQTVIKSLDEYQKEIARLVNSDPQNSESNETRVKLIKDTLSLSPTLDPVFRALDIVCNTNHSTKMDRALVGQNEAVVWKFLGQVIRQSRAAGCVASMRPVAKKLISDYMRPIYRNLGSQSSSISTITLQCLAALSNLCQSTTRELWNTFNFTHRSLPGFLTAKKHGQRQAYIEFLVGFLRLGDVQCKRELLEMKLICGGLLKFIAEDSPSTVESLLDVVNRRIVCDPELPHSLKLALLNSHNLEQVVRLYQRHEDSVRSACHSFLQQICCRPGHGICFQSDGWFGNATASSGQDASTNAGDSGRNKILLQLVGQLRPLDCQLQAELMLAIFKSAPEIVHQFWRLLQTSTQTPAGWQFEPRADDSRWLATMNFVMQTIQLPIPSLIRTSNHRINFKTAGSDEIYRHEFPLRSVIVENILPSPLSKILIGKAFQLSDSSVQYTMAVVLLAALDKLSDICNRIRDLPAKGQGDYSAALCIAVRKRVPDFQLIVALFNRLATDDSLAEDQMEIDDSDDDANDHENDSTLLAIGILRIIKRYLDLFQDVVSEEKFDFGRLMRMLPKITTPKSDLLQLSIMEIIYQVSDQFQWYKKSAGETNCYLMKILKTGQQTPHITVRRFIFDRLLPRLLWPTNAFELAPHEVAVWLECLERQSDSAFESCAEFFVECLQDLRSRPAHFIRLYDDAITPLLPKDSPYLSSYTNASPHELAKFDLPSYYCTPSHPLLPFDTSATDCIESNPKYPIIPFSLLIVAAVDKFAYWKQKSDKLIFVANVSQFLPIVFCAIARQTQVTPSILQAYARQNAIPDDALPDDSISLTSPHGAMRRLNAMLLLDSSNGESWSRIYSLFEQLIIEGNSMMIVECALMIFLNHPSTADKLLQANQMIIDTICRIMELIVGKGIVENNPTIRRICNAVCKSLLLQQSELSTEHCRILVSLLEDPWTIFAEYLGGVRIRICQAIMDSIIARNAAIPPAVFPMILSAIERRRAASAPLDELVFLFSSAVSHSKRKVDDVSSLNLVGGNILNDGAIGIESRLHLASAIASGPVVRQFINNNLPDKLPNTILSREMLRSVSCLLQRTRFVPAIVLHRLIKDFYLAESNWQDLELADLLCKLLDNRSDDSGEPFASLIDLEQQQQQLPLNGLTLRLSSQLLPPRKRMYLLERGLQELTVTLESRGPLKEAQLDAPLQTNSLFQQLCQFIEGFLPVFQENDGSNNNHISQAVAVSGPIMKRFVLACLKYGLVDPQAISLCDDLIRLGWYDSATGGPAFPLATLFQMVLNHSKFNLCVCTRDEPEIKASLASHSMLTGELNLGMQCPLPVWSALHERRREALFRLLLDIASRQSSTSTGSTTFTSAQIPVLLAFYSGSRRRSDQLIERLLMFIERETGMSIMETLMQGGWLISSGGLTVDAVDSRWMLASALHFDCSQSMTSDLSSSTATVGEGAGEENENSLLFYSQRFWLSAIAHWLNAAKEPDVLARLVETNCLALAIRALSSRDQQCRRLAYTIIDGVYEALAAVTMPSSTSHSDSHAAAENDNQEDLNNDYDDDENDFEGGEEEKDESAAIQVDQQQIGRAVKEKRQIFLLLHSLSSGIAVAKSETPNDDYYRVPLVITAFAVQALQIIARPEGELYPLINRFLLQRPFINMNDIPMLYDLFNCTDDRMARRCRTLIVRIILGSLQTGRRRSSTEDLKLLNRRHVLPLLYSAYYEPTMDKSFKRLILEVLGAAVRQFNGGWRELSRSGLVNFLDQLLARCSDVKAEDDCLPVVNVLKDCVVTTINQQINIPHELESDSSDDESDEASSCASDSSSNNTSDSGSDSDSDDEEDIVHQMEIEQSTEKAVKEKSMWISFSAQLIQLLERLSASHGATSSSDIKEISTVLLSAMKSTDGRTLELIDRLQQLIHN